MADLIEVKVSGVTEVQEELVRVADNITGPPMVKAMRDALVPLMRDARTFAPSDMSKLRGNILPAVFAGSNVVKGVVGSNLKYAPFQELGTGTFAGKAPHFPPPSALAVWARRKGLDAWAVAISIYRRGGLRPLRYMARAFEQNKDAVVKIIEDAVARMVK